VLATPSLYAYNKTRAGREILKNSLADFLFVRSCTLNGFVRDHVPRFIRDIMRAMRTWVTDDTAAVSLRKALCELFVRNCSDALKCVLNDFNKIGLLLQDTISATNTVNLVAAAAATGNINALRHFATVKKSSLWARSPAFGYPLDAAVYAGQTAVVKAMTQQAITNQSQAVATISYTEHLAFREAVCTGIELGDSEMVVDLLRKYNDAFGLPTKACMKAWFDKAITSGNEEMLRLMLTMRSKAGKSTIYSAFEKACDLAKPVLIRLFFDPNLSKNYLSVNEIHGNAYPLLTAVNVIARSVIVVTTLLKLGANPNGPAYLAGLDRPLRVAARWGRGAACLALLEEGANPNLVTNVGWMKSAKKSFGKDTKTGKALRIAQKLCEKPRAARDENFLVEVKEEEENLELEEESLEMEEENLEMKEENPDMEGYDEMMDCAEVLMHLT
jgi:hypothetical protein